MPKPPFERADRVAAKLAADHGKKSWLRGVAVEGDEAAGFHVTVRYDRELAVPPELPREVDGVPVVLVPRGHAKAQR